MAFTHSHINAFVIVGGDSDFITLVEKLKQYDRKVFVVGGRAFTSQVMQKNCTEFIAYENVVPDPSTGSGSSRAQSRDDRGRHPRQEKGDRPKASGSQPIEQAVPLVQRALEGAGRSRSDASARTVEEHAAAAGLVVLRARLRRRQLPRIRRQACQAWTGVAQASGAKHARRVAGPFDSAGSASGACLRSGLTVDARRVGRPNR